MLNGNIFLMPNQTKDGLSFLTALLINMATLQLMPHFQSILEMLLMMEPITLTQLPLANLELNGKTPLRPQLQEVEPH